MVRVSLQITITVIFTYCQTLIPAWIKLAAGDYDEQTEHVAFLTLCLLYLVLLLPFVLRSCFMTIISWGGERNALNENV